jgi:DNA repair protein RadC
MDALPLARAPRPTPAPAAQGGAADRRLDLAGPEGLSAGELLEVLLGRSGVLRLEARARPGVLDGLADLSSASVGELVRSRALTRREARRLVAAFALGRRAAGPGVRRGQLLRTTGEVYEAYGAALRGLKKEQMLGVLLDAKNRVLKEERVSMGTLTSSLVHPREVFAGAIRESAAGVILMHNHPSGDPEPSPEDEAVTRRLVAVGDLIGIQLLDHLIVGEGCYVSLLERGLVPALRGGFTP